MSGDLRALAERLRAEPYPDPDDDQAWDRRRWRHVLAIRRKQYRMLAETHRAWPGAADVLIVNARALLDPGDQPPLESITVQRSLKWTGSSQPDFSVEGYARRRAGTVRLNASGEAYQRAKVGDLRYLAALIAHEAHHLKHDDGGAGACRTQARVLRELRHVRPSAW